jgi:hypothetical protein
MGIYNIISKMMDISATTGTLKEIIPVYSDRVTVC